MDAVNLQGVWPTFPKQAEEAEGQAYYPPAVVVRNEDDLILLLLSEMVLELEL